MICVLFALQLQIYAVNLKLNYILKTWLYSEKMFQCYYRYVNVLFTYC